MGDGLIVFENEEGKVLKSFPWSGKNLHLIRWGDNQKIEFLLDTEFLENTHQEFEEILKIDGNTLLNSSVKLDRLGSLKLVNKSLEQSLVLQDVTTENKPERLAWWLFLVGLLLVSISLKTIFTRTEVSEKLEQSLRQQIVKIAKALPPRVVTPVDKLTPEISVKNRTTPQKNKSDAIKRMGALGVLGRLNNSKQRGGLNLGASQVSPGPGLGGTQGSGGVQASLYGKGIVAAPLGVGGNLQGAGGYGTKGKGGGMDGYGRLELTGSLGDSPIAKGTGGSSSAGLEKDQIADVIAKNMGQIRFCYEQGLQSDPSLKGRVAVDFVIGPTGGIKSTGINNTTLNSKIVEDCILVRLKTWKFPLPQGGVDVKVTYPFMLRRAGQG